MDDYEVKKIAEAIRDEKCILFLGPDLATASVGGKERTLNDLVADDLRAKMDRKELVSERDALAHIAQVFVSTESRYDRSYIAHVIKQRVESFDQINNETLNQLAALPFRICICSSYDNALERAFKLQDTPKEPVCQYFNFKRKGQSTPVLTRKAEEPLIYKLYGSPDDSTSLAFTEDDLIDFHAAIIKDWLPSNLQAKLKEDAVWLFLGFGLHQWHIKILFRMLREVKQDSTLSFGFETSDLLDQVSAGENRKHQLNQARVFFEHRQKLILGEVSADEFVDRLVSAFEQLDEPKKSSVDWKGGAPRVFISYTREDESHLKWVSDRLFEAGIEVWKDDQLRVGDDWKEEIKTQLRDVDYLLLLLSKNTEDPEFNKEVKLESYWRYEVDYFLDRGKRTSERVAEKMILPLLVEECKVPVKVGHFHAINFYEDGSYAELLSEIKKSWQLFCR